jgi:hypothetical protein
LHQRLGRIPPLPATPPIEVFTPALNRRVTVGRCGPPVPCGSHREGGHFGVCGLTADSLDGGPVQFLCVQSRRSCVRCTTFGRRPGGRRLGGPSRRSTHKGSLALGPRGSRDVTTVIGEAGGEASDARYLRPANQHHGRSPRRPRHRREDTASPYPGRPRSRCVADVSSAASPAGTASSAAERAERLAARSGAECAAA